MRCLACLLHYDRADRFGRSCECPGGATVEYGRGEHYVAPVEPTRDTRSDSERNRDRLAFALKRSRTERRTLADGQTVTVTILPSRKARTTGPGLHGGERNRWRRAATLIPRKRGQGGTDFIRG